MQCWINYFPSPPTQKQKEKKRNKTCLDNSNSPVVRKSFFQWPLLDHQPFSKILPPFDIIHHFPKPNNKIKMMNWKIVVFLAPRKRQNSPLTILINSLFVFIVLSLKNSDGDEDNERKQGSCLSGGYVGYCQCPIIKRVTSSFHSHHDVINWNGWGRNALRFFVLKLEKKKEIFWQMWSGLPATTMTNIGEEIKEAAQYVALGAVIGGVSALSLQGSAAIFVPIIMSSTGTVVVGVGTIHSGFLCKNYERKKKYFDKCDRSHCHHNGFCCHRCYFICHSCGYCWRSYGWQLLCLSEVHAE